MIALALQLAAAFNLVCAGTVRAGPLGLALPEEQGEAIAETYRIDLGAGLWCRGDCTRTEPVTEVAESYVVLRDSHDPAGGNFIMVALPSGGFVDTNIVDSTAVLRSGRCQRAAFSGFPSLTA
jgi:hypothetical protein